MSAILSRPQCVNKIAQNSPHFADIFKLCEWKSCGMAGCWQINSILDNIGHKNSIREF